jgi:hypothetical protein
MTEQPLAVFLTGPIGVGKSTLAAGLACALGGYHVEGDSHHLPDQPWYAASLHTSRSILQEIISHAPTARRVFISYPIRCREWLFQRRHLGASGIRTAFVALAADPVAIEDPARGRSYSPWERERIVEMVRQGYDHPAFCDFRVRTDEAGVDATLQRIISQLDARGWSSKR